LSKFWIDHTVRDPDAVTLDPDYPMEALRFEYHEEDLTYYDAPTQSTS
jgi:hypothetical protein